MSPPAKRTRFYWRDLILGGSPPGDPLPFPKGTKNCGSLRTVLMELGEHANQDGHAWPAVKTMHERTGMSRQAVRASLEKLEELGFIAWAGIYVDREIIQPPERPRGEGRRVDVWDLAPLEALAQSRDGVANHRPGETRPRLANPKAGGGAVNATPGAAETRHPGPVNATPERSNATPSVTNYRTSGTSTTEPPERATPSPAREGSRNPCHRSHRGAIVDALVELESTKYSAMPKGRKSLMYNLARQLEEVGATADDVRARAERWRELHPDWDLTAPAIVKHWAFLKPTPRAERSAVS